MLYICSVRKESKYCRCLFFASGALARTMTRIAEEEFSPTGLAPSYAFLLMTVNEEPGIQAGEIAAIMELTPSTVTRLIEKMEAKKMLERRVEGKHTFVYPTSKSKALDKIIRESWSNLYQRYVAILGEKKSKEIADAIYTTSRRLTE